MERILQETADGSHTIAIPGMQVTYHSRHGAIQESRHVFIEAGLHPVLSMKKKAIHILEMGFGTGLNALLTLLEPGIPAIWYESLEAFPLEMEIAGTLNYGGQLQDAQAQPALMKLHQCPWEEWVAISETFWLRKRNALLTEFQPDKQYDLIYFDAFAPGAQPELWTREVFQKLFDALMPGGILVTYCSKGDVRRALQAAGFVVEKIPGPPGKREMLRARKTADPS